MAVYLWGFWFLQTTGPSTSMNSLRPGLEVSRTLFFTALWKKKVLRLDSRDGCHFGLAAVGRPLLRWIRSQGDLCSTSLFVFFQAWKKSGTQIRRSRSFFLKWICVSRSNSATVFYLFAKVSVWLEVFLPSAVNSSNFYLKKRPPGAAFSVLSFLSNHFRVPGRAPKRPPASEEVPPV